MEKSYQPAYLFLLLMLLLRFIVVVFVVLSVFFVDGVVSSLALVAVVFIDCPHFSSINLFLLQVLPVVNEQNRYGGEMTGIRSHLTRSIKIK